MPAPDVPAREDERAQRTGLLVDSREDALVQLFEEAWNADEKCRPDVGCEPQDVFGPVDEIASGTTAQGEEVKDALKEVCKR